MTLDCHDLGIIADDLTGACDVAASFAAQLGPVGVAVAPNLKEAPDEDVRVINTQSRLWGADTARNCLQNVGSALIFKKVIFKKMDAGLRGPVGAELAGLLAGLSRSGSTWECVVAPAIPSIGRTTRGGIQYDRGVPIHQGGLRHDPHSPQTSADIRQIIEQTGGGNYRVADAENSEDLERIINEYLERGRVVFAGSLGLARALAGRVHARERSVQDGARAHRPMLVSGSRHPLAARQMEQVQSGGNRVVHFNPIERSFGDAVDFCSTEPVFVDINPGGGREANEAPEALLTTFVEATARLRERFNSDGLAVIGGETAYQLLVRLGARRLHVFRSQDEVIAISKISGGAMDGCRFVSKGGSVGSMDAACQMLSVLTS